MWPRFLKSAYRNEPVTGFLITVGVVDAAIGGFSYHGSLLLFGLSTVGAAIALRWWQLQRTKALQTEQVPRYFLPARSSRTQLPMLSMSKKQPPN